MMKDNPKVSSSSWAWPWWCTRRRKKRSTTTPITPTSSGEAITAGQKPMTPCSE
ncbi:Uncharacterised protein [Mycobacterium tuberculosis]|nr:Uncharacterised protein [Mycobacterium tuberculosis]